MQLSRGSKMLGRWFVVWIDMVWVSWFFIKIVDMDHFSGGSGIVRELNVEPQLI